MANISEFAEALAKETKLAQKYEALAAETQNPEYKQQLEELLELSTIKMEKVYALMTSIKWFN